MQFAALLRGARSCCCYLELHLFHALDFGQLAVGFPLPAEPQVVLEVETRLGFFAPPHARQQRQERYPNAARQRG